MTESSLLTKMIYYEPVKVTIVIRGLIEIITKVVVQLYDLADLIVSDQNLVFTSKF